MFFFAIVAPVLRSVDDDALRQRLFEALGKRFRLVGWVCVGVLVATGVEQFRVRRAGRAVPGSPEAGALRRKAALLARANALIGVVLVFAAVRLGR